MPAIDTLETKVHWYAMKRITSFVIFAVAGLSLLWVLSGNAGLPISEHIEGVFRTRGEADSLRAVLQDSSARGTLQSTANRLALFNVGSAQDADVEAGEVWYHLFEFESPYRRSTKMYRIVFVSRKGADGSYDVELVRAQFESDESPENSGTPVAVGSFQFRALLEFFSRDSTFHVLRALIDGGRTLHSFRLVQTGTRDQGATLRFVGKNGDFDDPTAAAVVEYNIEFDARTEVFEFARVQ